jgi:peptidoglycan/xylan/chitin deacetylase (PgdA/CDA1 family)
VLSSSLKPALGGLKRAAKRAFATPLGWRLAGPLLRAPGVIVLMYHRINGADSSFPGLPVESFAAQMRWLRDNCDVIAPEALIERAQRPTRVRPAVLITFDDGYRDYHDRAYPVLKQLGLPAVVFIATSFIDHGGMIWTEEVQAAATATRLPRVSLPWSDAPAVELPDERARAALGARARAHLKTLPDADRQQAVQALLVALGGEATRERQMLNWDEVRRTMDLTRYGGHTHTHPILSRVDRAAAEREIRTCRDRIADETGRVPTLFAYPNGTAADFTSETQDLLRQSGFRVGFSTIEGIAGAGTDWMAVKRLPGAGRDLPEFVWAASGLVGS